MKTTNEQADLITNKYFPVLDYGFVSLVDYMGGDDDVVKAARVSYGAGSKRTRDDRALIRYLQRNHHGTPFEMVELKFHCAMPIFVARQWIRHRTASVNEMSGRYSKLPMCFYTPDEWRTQSRTNKQASSEDHLNAKESDHLFASTARLRVQSMNHYQELLSHDVARELARIDLPVSTYTQWYWKIDLRNLLHFLGLRLDPHAQPEMQAYARVMAGIAKRVAPMCVEAWLDYDFCSTRFSRQEMAILVSSFAAVEQGNATKEFMSEQVSLHTMSTNEIRELATKLQHVREVPSFELDMNQAKDAEFFERLYEMHSSAGR